MVVAKRKCSPTTPDFTQQYTLRTVAVLPIDPLSRDRPPARLLLALWRGLLDGVTDGDPLAEPALRQCRPIVRNRRHPIGQDREGFLARPANPAPHPNIFVSIIVCLSKPSSVADDRVVLASWASPWKKFQRDYPGSRLTFGSGSAIKSVTTGVKPSRRPSLQRFDLLAGPSPSQQVSVEQKE